MSKPYKVSRSWYMKIKFKKIKVKFLNAIIELKYKIKTRGFGYWYCEHCCKLHGPRVVEHVDCYAESVCSVGKKKMILEGKAKESEYLAYCGGVNYEKENK